MLLGAVTTVITTINFRWKIQQLDSDLDNRWSTTGVVIIDVKANGPASRANLETGELISYVIGERTIRGAGDFNQAVKNAMKEDNNFIVKLTDGREIRLAVRRSGDKVGLEVDGARVSQVTSGSPADTGNIKVGDTIQSVVDERNIQTIKDYKKALNEFAKHDSKVTFRTTELIGIKIGTVNALGNVGRCTRCSAINRNFRESRQYLASTSCRSLRAPRCVKSIGHPLPAISASQC